MLLSNVGNAENLTVCPINKSSTMAIVRMVEAQFSTEAEAERACLLLLYSSYLESLEDLEHLSALL